MKDTPREMGEETAQEKVSRDLYVQRFLTSPVYTMVMRDTIDTAARSYKFARLLSVILFTVGIVLIGIAVIFSFIGKEATFSLFFGGLGTANLITLLLYRPIERIQSGVDALIKSQIACLSFQAQYDSIAGALARMPPDTNQDVLLRMAQYLRDATTQTIADLGLHAPLSSVTKPDSERERCNGS